MAEDEISDKPDYLGHRQRLRQRFLLGEGRDMADYELLELLLTLALPRRDVKPLAKQLVQTFGSFSNVLTAPEARLREIAGIKDSVITVFKLVNVSTQRLCWQNLSSEQSVIINSTDTLVDYCRATLAYAEVEELHLIYLDARLKAIGHDLIQRGSVSSVSASPREIVTRALNKNAVGLIMVHNHPSGTARPSNNDITLTNAVDEACQLMNIRLQEHLIITRSEYFSFSEQGMLLINQARGRVKTRR